MTKFETSRLLATLVLALLLIPKGLTQSADDVLDEAMEPNAYPVSGASNFEQMQIPPYNHHVDKPRGCFHFYVSQNMSLLLSEATKMLQQVRDRGEREWILTFIYRIKSLAEHLRTHPESQNYDCLQGENEMRRRSPQQELYFVDDMQTNNQKRAVPNSNSPVQSGEVEGQQPITNVQAEAIAVTSADQQEDAEDASELQDEIADEYFPKIPPGAWESPQGRLVLSEPNCDIAKKCRRGLKNRGRDLKKALKEGDGLVLDAGIGYVSRVAEVKKIKEKRRLRKQKIRNALLEEMAPQMQKLRKAGGKEKDLINLWQQSSPIEKEDKRTDPYTDFDYEEDGAAAGDPSTNDRYTTSGRTVAPSIGEIKNFKRQSSKTASTTPYEPSDGLVQQLLNVRHEAVMPKESPDANKDEPSVAGRVEPN